MKKRTRTYRRDVARKGKYWAQTDNEAWDNALKTLEKARSGLPKRFHDDRGARHWYEYAHKVLEEVGSVEGLPDAIDASYLPPEQRKRVMQEVLTRISRILGPKDQGNNQQGQGEGEGDDGDQDGEQQEPEFSDPDKNEDDKHYNPGGTNGGGAQRYSDSKDQSIFYATRFLIRKLAEHDDRTNRQPLGHDTWNAQKILAAHYKPNQLPIAKEGWGKQVDDVFLTLDTSGSVNQWAELIAGVAAGSAGIVHLFSGGEADPYYYVDRHTPLSHPQEPFPEWHSQKSIFDWTGDNRDWNRFSQGFVEEWQPSYPHLMDGCFEVLVAWLIKTQKPKKGSRLLFWGDTEGTGIMAPKLLKQLVAPYRMAWLYSESFWLLQEWQKTGKYDYHMERCADNPDDYSCPEYPKLMAVGIPVIAEVTSPESFRRALKVLQTQK